MIPSCLQLHVTTWGGALELLLVWALVYAGLTLVRQHFGRRAFYLVSANAVLWAVALALWTAPRGVCA